MATNTITKKLEYVPLGKLGIINSLVSIDHWDEESERAVKISIEKRGVATAYIAVKLDESYGVVDGKLRLKHELELHGPDHLVPVWVIEGEYTEEQIRQLIFDLDKRRKKSNVNILDEFHFLDKRIPNNQGKKGGDEDKHRKTIIAKEIGVSYSKIVQLLKIDRIKPSLLRAVDLDQITLQKALATAKEIEDARNNSENTVDSSSVPSGPHPVYSASNIHIDLNSLSSTCPCCNIPYSKLDWTDIPNIFTYKRKEEDKQIDWLKAVA